MGKPLPKNVRMCNRWCTAREFAQSFLNFMNDADGKITSIMRSQAQDKDLVKDMRNLRKILADSKSVVESFWKMGDGEWFPVAFLASTTQLGHLAANIKTAYEEEDDRFVHMPEAVGGRKLEELVGSEHFVTTLRRLAAIWHHEVAFFDGISAKVRGTKIHCALSRHVGNEDGHETLTILWEPPAEWLR